jgi:hypothetical protein
MFNVKTLLRHAVLALALSFSNLTGAVGAVDWTDGEAVFNADGSITLGNNPGLLSLLSFNALFGGVLGFDLAFGDDYSAETGTDGSSGATQRVS